MCDGYALYIIDNGTTNTAKGKTHDVKLPRPNLLALAIMFLTLARCYHAGGTKHDIAERSGIDYYVAQRRASVLETNRLAVRDGTAINPVTGKRCTVWRAT